LSNGFRIVENWLIWLLLVLLAGVGMFLFVRYGRSRALHSVKSGETEAAPAAGAATIETAAEASAPIERLRLERDGRVWRVLVIDDLIHWADSITRFATLFDCEIRTATNLSVAARELAQWQPHLIILDLHMPRDAWEPVAPLRAKYEPHQKSLAFCRQVTADPAYRNIMVVIASVEEQPEQQALARRAGAHRFYTKGSFSVADFEDLLAQARARALRDETAATT
jgi:CheY-like chemotaxis protein